MIVWLLLVVLLEGGPTIPLEIFPNTGEGEASCRQAAKEVRTLVQNPHDVTCERHTLTPVRATVSACTPWSDSC